MKRNTIKLILIGCLVIFFLTGLVIELPLSMNYLQVRHFWKTSMLLGISLGAAAGGILIGYLRKQLKDGVAQMQLFSAVFFSVLLTTPLFVSWINRVGVSTTGVSPTTVVFESEQARFSSRFGSSRLQKPQANQYLLFFYLDGQLYRLQDDQPFFPEAALGDTLQLHIITGRLGYEWVKK